MRLTEAGEGFFETFNLSFAAGNGYTGNPAIDADRVILNETAAHLLGFDNIADAPGNHLALEGDSWVISGVVHDFYQLSPKEALEPQLFRIPRRQQGYFTLNYGHYAPAQILPQLEKLYVSFFPGNPFDYFFLDDFYGSQFQHERRFGAVFALFSILVILVTVLGLIGLAAFTAEQRKKEIGIRKVLGASEKKIFLMLFRDYLWLWLVAALLAIPPVWMLLHRWLSDFALRMPLQPGLFILPLGLVLLVSLVTVWIMSRRIVCLNPVGNLKYE